MITIIILIREGKIAQEGTPDVLYDRPATAFSASFIGTPPMNILNTVVSDNGVMIESENHTPVLAKSASPVMLGIRPEHVKISDSQGIPAELVSGDYLGAETVITARIGSQEILVRAAGRVRVTKPVAAHLSWSDQNIHVFDSKSGKRNDSVQGLAV